MIKNNTILQEYCLFPYHLGEITLGQLKERIKKRGGRKKDIKKLVRAITSNPKEFIEVYIQGGDTIEVMPFSYRLSQLTWWERFFTFADFS